jgi:hypothetical protein
MSFSICCARFRNLNYYVVLTSVHSAGGRIWKKGIIGKRARRILSAWRPACGFVAFNSTRNIFLPIVQLSPSTDGPGLFTKESKKYLKNQWFRCTLVMMPVYGRPGNR